MQIWGAERSAVTGLLVMAAYAVLLEDGGAPFGFGIRDGGSRVGKTNQICGHDRTGGNQNTDTPQNPTTTRHCPNASSKFSVASRRPLSKS
jgi:hypothetical protein